MKAGFLNRERSRDSSSRKLSTRNSSVCSTKHTLQNGGVVNSSSSPIVRPSLPPSTVKEPPHLALLELARGYAGDKCCQACPRESKYLLQCDSEGASCPAFTCFICILKKQPCRACRSRPSRALCKAAQKGSEKFLADSDKNGGALPGSPPLLPSPADDAVLEPPPLDVYDDMPELIEGTDSESESESDVEESKGVAAKSAIKGKPVVATSCQPSLGSAPLSNETSTSEYDSESDDGDEAPELLSADEESEGEGDSDIKSPPPVSVSKPPTTSTSYSFIPTQHQREKLYPDARPFTSSPTSPTTTSESAGEQEGREEMEISEKEKNRAKKAAAKKLKKKKKQEDTRKAEEAPTQMLQEERVAVAQPTPLTTPSPVSSDSASQSPSGPVMLKHDPNKKQPDYCLEIDCRIVEHFKNDSGCSLKELVKSTKAHCRKKTMQQKSVQPLVLVMDNFDGYGVALSEKAPRRLCVFGRKQEVAYVVNSIKSIFRNPPMWFPNDLAPLRPRSGEQDFKEARDAAARLLSAGSGFSFPLSRVASSPGGVQDSMLPGHAEFFAGANVAGIGPVTQVSAMGRMSDSSTMPPASGASLAPVSADFDPDTEEISTFMKGLGLTRYRDRVLQEGVSLDGLKAMEESDLNELFEGKIPRGSLIKIRKALQALIKIRKALQGVVNFKREVVPPPTVHVPDLKEETPPPVQVVNLEQEDCGGMCKACWESEPTIVMLPCRHTKVCSGCMFGLDGSLSFKKCPTCACCITGACPI